jgi:hypothetical protein
MIAAGTGYWMFCLQRKRTAKDVFHEVITNERVRLDVMKSRESEFLEQSMPIVGQAVHRVTRYLSKTDRDRLLQVLRHYQSQPMGSTDRGMARIAAGFTKDTGVGEGHFTSLEKFLNEFDECVR